LASRYWQKDVHCRSGDIAIVRGDFYSDCTLPDGSSAKFSENECDEDEPDEKTKVIAIIRGPRKIQARQQQRHQGHITDGDSVPTRFFFSCGATWEAITAQNGDHYQLVAVNAGENKVIGDYKMISWTRESVKNGGDTTQTDVRFRLRIVDGNFQDLPLFATATRHAIEITYQPPKHDKLQSLLSSQASLDIQSKGREKLHMPSARNGPFGSLDTSFSESLYLLCLVLTSAIWVASSEGWLNL
jgi:hypothetical protein